MTWRWPAAAWLARRLLRARHQRVALVVAGTSSLILSLMVLSILAVPGVVADQRAVRSLSDVQNSSDVTGLRAFRQQVDWRDRYVVQELVVAPDPGWRGTIPGVAQWQAGETWVSPALKAMIDDDPALAKAFDATDDRVLREDAVESSAALRSVRILSVDDFDAQAPYRELRSANAILGAEAGERSIDPTLLTLALVAVLLLGVLPVWLILASSFSAVAIPRRRQQALLEQIGLAGRRSRRLVSADVVVVGVIAGALALVLFPLVTRVVTALPGVPAAWSAGQPGVNWTGMLVVLLIPFLASWNASRPGRIGRRGAAAPGIAGRGSLVQDLAAVAVVALAIWQVLTHRDLRMDASPEAARVGALLIVILLVAAALAQRSSARLLGRTVRRLLASAGPGSRLGSLWVAGARVGRSRTSIGPAGALAGMFVLTVVVAPLVAAVAPQDQGTAAANDRAGRVLMTVTGGSPQMVSEQTQMIGSWSVGRARNGRSEVVMMCAQARTVLSLSSCHPGLVVTEKTLTPSLRPQLSNLLQPGWRILTTDGDRANVPRTASSAPVITLIAVSERRLWDVRGNLWGAAPLAAVQTEAGGLFGGPSQPFLAMQKWLTAALCMGLVLSAGLVLLSAFATMRKTVTGDLRLFLVGLSRGQIMGVQVWTASITAIGMLVSMLGLGAVAVAVMPNWTAAPPISDGWLVLLGLIALTTAGARIAAGMAVVALARGSDSSGSSRPD